MKESTLGVTEISKNILDFFGKDIVDENVIKSLRKEWDRWAKRYA